MQQDETFEWEDSLGEIALEGEIICRVKYAEYTKMGSVESKIWNGILLCRGIINKTQ